MLLLVKSDYCIAHHPHPYCLRSQNWLIPGYNGSSHAPGDARDHRLVAAAAAAASAARAANQTSTAYTRRPDGTFLLPTDALGIAGMMTTAGGPGLADGTTFRDSLFLTQVAQVSSANQRVIPVQYLQAIPIDY